MQKAITPFITFSLALDCAKTLANSIKCFLLNISKLLFPLHSFSVKVSKPQMQGLKSKCKYPIVARTTEESLKLVPNSVREASLALGVHRWRTIVSVTLPAAKSGLITGTLLAVARIAGETAPLIMTILGNQNFFLGFTQPMDALPLRIWRNALQPSAAVQAQGWGAALVLILIVLCLNIGIRLVSRGRLRR